MALIICPECNKEVSDTAAACPHCGYNIAAYIGKQTEEQQRAEYLARQADEAAARQEKKASRKKMPTKKKVVITVCSVLVLAAVVVGLFPTWYHLFTGRDTFYTKKAMLEYLEGEWKIVRNSKSNVTSNDVRDLQNKNDWQDAMGSIEFTPADFDSYKIQNRIGVIRYNDTLANMIVTSNGNIYVFFLNNSVNTDEDILASVWECTK